MVGNVPGILPKTALVGSRVINYPFTIPRKFTDASYLVGQVNTNIAKGVADGVAGEYEKLQPRGPAKLLTSFLHRISDSATKSQAVADRNKAVFWDPISDGFSGIGQALGGPGAYWYLRKAGIDAPIPDQIKGVLNMGLFAFPDKDNIPGTPAPPPADPPPADPPPADPPADPKPPTDPPADPKPPANGEQGADTGGGTTEVATGGVVPPTETARTIVVTPQTGQAGQQVQVVG